MPVRPSASLFLQAEDKSADGKPSLTTLKQRGPPTMGAPGESETNMRKIAPRGAFNMLDCKIDPQKKQKGFIFNGLGLNCLNI